MDTTSWHDLPLGLTEVILAKVPLLRLAQLAAVAKDFKTVFDQLHSVHVAAASWVHDIPGAHFEADSSDVHFAEFAMRNDPTWDCKLRYATEPRA